MFGKLIFCGLLAATVGTMAGVTVTNRKPVVQQEAAPLVRPQSSIPQAQADFLAKYDMAPVIPNPVYGGGIPMQVNEKGETVRPGRMISFSGGPGDRGIHAGP